MRPEGGRAWNNTLAANRKDNNLGREFLVRSDARTGPRQKWNLRNERIWRPDLLKGDWLLIENIGGL